MIIVDHVNVSFRANKKMAAKIVAQAGTEVTHEVIAANKVGATDRAATGETLVEAQALPSDARREFGGRVLAQLGGVDSVKIIKKWTVRLEPAVQILTGSPGQFATHSKLPLQKKVCAEHRVGAAGQRHRRVASGGA